MTYEVTFQIRDEDGTLREETREVTREQFFLLANIKSKDIDVNNSEVKLP